MAVSVLTSHVFGPAKLISDAGGTEPAKFNIRIDPFYLTPPYAPPHPPQPHVLGGGWGTWG